MIALPSGKRFGTTEGKTLTAINWLKDFANSYAGYMPDSHQVHLPCCLTKTSVYNTMIIEVDDPVISLSHFLKIWRTELNYIAIPKVSVYIYNIKSPTD